MKNKLVALGMLAIIATACKKKEDSPTPDDPQTTTTTGTTTTGGGITSGYTGAINSGPLNVYVIDTAKINAISETGTAETTLLNKTVNTSSYIMSFSNSTDGSKFVYSVSQSNFSGPSPVYTKEIRTANANGSGDQLVYAIPGGTTYIGATRYGLSNKIYYTTDNFPSSDLYSINTDGTSNNKIFTWASGIKDVSVDGNYLLTSSSTGNNIQLIDRLGDGGAGSVYYTEIFASSITTMGNGCLSLDTKKAFIPYNESGSLKLRVIDLAAKTSSTKTVAAISGPYFFISAKVASDGDRVIITVTNGTNSTSYNYKVSTSFLSGSFINNDENISGVYPY